MGASIFQAIQAMTPEQHKDKLIYSGGSFKEPMKTR